MNPEIKQQTVNSYDVPVYVVESTEEDTKLVFTEQYQTVSFVRPEINMVTKDNVKEAQELLEKLHAKEERTSEDDKAIQQLEDLVSKGETTLKAEEGVTVGDLLTIIEAELQLLRANPQAIVKLQELKFWVTK